MSIVLRIAGGFIGGLVVFALLIGGAQKAFGQSVPTHEAELGEIDRSFTYPRHGLIAVNTRVYGDPTNNAWTKHFLDKTACEDMNEYLYATVAMIADRIVKDPVNGYMWVGALNDVHGMWCTSYD